jgi:hypothetical protein
MKPESWLVASVCICGLAARPAAAAPTWCSVNGVGAIFCEDFDRYCVNPPPAPEACSSEASPDGNPFDLVWEYSFMPCSLRGLSEAFPDSLPFAVKLPNQDHGQTTHAGVALTPFIRSAFGTSYASMLGTDQAPLIVEYSFHGQAAGRINSANAFLELALGPSQAPVDYVLSPNCQSCGGEDRRYETICQQQNAPAGCPPLSTAPHWASIGVGAIALLDADPCHCSGTVYSPKTYNLSFFDGYQWRGLRAGLFPGGGSGGPIPGDFQLRQNINRIRLTIRTSSIKVELTCLDPNPDEYSWCEIPRDYTGPFDHLYIGYRAPCRLKNNGEWECATAYDCIKGVPGGGVPHFDNFLIKGGLGYGPPGACCRPDTTCFQSFGALDCQARGGMQFHGSGTTCGAVACCPPLLPDHDLDGDVDVSDFGWFQRCLTDDPVDPPALPCTCADLNFDGKVNHHDPPIFIDCMSGPETPADAGCMN